MKKPLNAYVAAISVGLAGLAFPATADDSLTDRAASAVGHYIAAQGNAALVQIREELTRDLARQIRPYLPEPERVSTAGTPPPKTAQAQ